MTGHWPFFKFLILLSVGYSTADHCDRVSRKLDREGNLGQSGDFSWLGVLHVRLDEDWIATSGIVLIKTKHALANADDVARVPPNVFQSHSKAMFLPRRASPRFVKPVSYVTHPEYQYSTRYTIALVELNIDGVDDFPLTPICLATDKVYSASKYLYLTGFTHENQILEKVIYKIQHLNDKVCEKHYNRTEWSSNQLIPSYLCGYAPNSGTPCVWDNGMTLLSNDIGYLYLVGFGIYGPGCLSPARFLDLFPYLHWIHSITEERHYRRNEIAPKKRKGVISNIPIHKLYTMSGARRQGSLVHHYEAYPLDLEAMKFHLIEPSEDGNIYLIYPFKEKWEEPENSCSMPTVVIYSEIFNVTAVDHFLGSATYKLSLYDTIYSKCICVRLTVKCDSRSDAILSFKEEINFKDTNLDGFSVDRTPEEVLKHFSLPKKGSEKVFLKPYMINDDDIVSRKVLNYDLFITFKFTERAALKFEMLAEKPKKTTTSTTEPTTSPTESETTPTKNEEDAKELRRAEIEEQAVPKYDWGRVNKADRIIKEEDVRVVAEGDENEMQEMQSVACGEKASGVTVMGSWLMGSYMFRVLFI